MNEEPILPQMLLQQAEFVRSLARSLLGDEHLAEDVVQETWIAALEKSPAHVVNVRAWLGTVARNLTRRIRRGEARRDQRERLAARPEAVEWAPKDEMDRSDDVGGAHDNESTLRSVTEAVLALDEPYRSTVLLRYFEGLDAAHIAARQEISIATVRSRLQRALAKLRERLDREHGDRSAWSSALAMLAGQSGAGSVPITPPSASRTAPLAPSMSLASGLVIMCLKSKLGLIAFALLVGWALWTRPWQITSRALDVANASTLPIAVQIPGASAPVMNDVVPSDRASVLPQDAVRAQSTAVDPFGSLLVHVTYEASGLPAAGAHLRLMVWDGPEPFANRILGVTDANGDYRCERVHAGKVGIYEHHGAGGSVDIRSGEETRAEFSIPRGIRVKGLVVDREGVPVADADIWLSDYFNAQEWLKLTTSRRDGTFEIPEMEKSYFVAARDRRHGPSGHIKIDGKPGDTCELRLIVGDEAVRIEGRVFDAQGSPVRGARVRINDIHSDPGSARTSANEYKESSIPELTTDEFGRFTCDGIAPGWCAVSVRAPRYAPLRTSTTIGRGAEWKPDLTLQPGVSVHGIARTEDGKPASGAWIWVGEYGEFLSSGAKAAPDGSYRLESVASGDIQVRATSQTIGRADGALRGKPGEDLEWNPVLSSGLQLIGRVVDERGVPLSGWGVDATAWVPNRNNQFRSAAKTDAGGRFSIINCPEQPMRVSFLEDFAHPAGFVMDGVRAGKVEQVFRVPDLSRLNASIDGIVIDKDGTAAALSVSVWNLETQAGQRVNVSQENGAFHSGSLASGRYFVTALDKSDVTYGLGKHDLARDQRLDLGRIQLEPPGRLVIHLNNIEKVGGDGIYYSLRPVDRDDEHRGLSWDNEKIPESKPLAPGEYELRIGGANRVATTSYHFVIRPSEETLVEVEPRLGTIRGFRIAVAPGASVPPEVLVDVVDSAGNIVEESEMSMMSLTELRVSYILAPGDYNVRAAARDGRRGESNLHVDLEWSNVQTEILLR